MLPDLCIDPPRWRPRGRSDGGPSAAAFARARGRSQAGGFTLVELMVALLAGLIVSMAMVGLSKQVMNTFHEEARNASAQAALRIGMERLRSDLAAAGFMSTGNILADNQSAHFGGSIPVCIGQSTTTGGYLTAPPVLDRLASIHLYQGGATAATLPLETNNNLSPDKFDLGGNYTNGEDYVGHIVTKASVAGNDGSACGSQVFQLDMNTAAGWRLANLCNSTPGGCTSTAGPLYNAFNPGTNAALQYMVRIADNSNPSLFQYALVCPNNPVAFVSAVSPNPSSAYINLDTSWTPVGDTAGSAGCKLSNWDAGNGLTRIAAVQVVQWDVQPVTALPASYGYMASKDPNNLVLTRTYVDGTGGGSTGGVTPDATTLEVVAEYVVDLKLAFSVDQTVNGTISPPGMYVTNPLLHIPFDATANQTWAYDVSTATGAQLTQGVGPQRIRSARVRLVTRTALPDRSSSTKNVAGVVPPPTTAGSNYIYRYCIGTASDGKSCAADSVTWARARTDISEVSLPNQARSFY